MMLIGYDAAWLEDMWNIRDSPSLGAPPAAYGR
jgi:hypothetical protein